ncbi:MAG: ComF family protein [Candidatus Peregrinibacteria bacterium]|nr:ComF family protein [Candidatus Peregrinibacteria bacterium]MDZ4244473.1 ComF family protein [Candidatus Gracilibacteria bacterium]
MKQIVSLLATFLDFFFPRICLGCDMEGAYLCHTCENLLKETVSQNSLHTDFLDTVFIACEYDNQNLIGKLIKRIKYKFSEELADSLADIVVQNLIDSIDWSNIGILIPVPLSKERRKWRGFNQAELIGGKIVRRLNKLGIDTRIEDEILRKVKDTPPQAACSSKLERLANVENAFEVNKNIRPPNAVILFDDVYTTGTTMNECAKTLKNAGVKNVFGLVIAKKKV